MSTVKISQYTGDIKADSGSFNHITVIGNIQGGLPSGLISSSQQIDNLFDIDGLVSSSQQIDDLGFLKVSGDSVISSSAQISDDISGSLSATAIAGLAAGIISSSDQILPIATSSIIDFNTEVSRSAAAAGFGVGGGGFIPSLSTDLEAQNITSSGNISSSGVLSIPGFPDVSASLAAAGGGGFTPSLSTDITARNITASVNIWASGSGGFTGRIYSDSYFINNDSGIQKQLLARLNDILYVGDNSLDAVQFSGGIDRFLVQSDITASGDISSSGDIYTTQLYINNNDAPAIKSTLPAFGFPGELNIGGWVTSQYNSVTPTHNTRLTGQNIDIIPSGGLQIYSHTDPDRALYINYDAGGTKYTKLWGSWEADDISLTSITASGAISASAIFLGATSQSNAGKTPFVDFLNTGGIGGNGEYRIGVADNVFLGPAYSLNMKGYHINLESAYGLISASAPDVLIQSQYTGYDNNEIRLGYLSGITISSANNLNITGNTVDITGPITASGDISSSGDLYANNLYIEDKQALSWSSGLLLGTFGVNTTKINGSGIQLTGNANMSLTTVGAGDITISAADDFSITGDTVDITGPITASGAISASGNITATDLEIRNITASGAISASAIFLGALSSSAAGKTPFVDFTGSGGIGGYGEYQIGVADNIFLGPSYSLNMKGYHINLESVWGLVSASAPEVLIQSQYSGYDNNKIKLGYTSGIEISSANNLNITGDTVNITGPITASGAISASGEISAYGSSSFHGLPTTEPSVTGALWISGSSPNHPNSGYLMVFNP